MAGGNKLEILLSVKAEDSPLNKLKSKMQSILPAAAKVEEKIQEQNRKERALWLKIGQRVRIIGSTSIGTIEKIDAKNNKVTLNYGLFTTQISADELERV